MKGLLLSLTLVLARVAAENAVVFGQEVASSVQSSSTAAIELLNGERDSRWHITPPDNCCGNSWSDCSFLLDSFL